MVQMKKNWCTAVRAQWPCKNLDLKKVNFTQRKTHFEEVAASFVQTEGRRIRRPIGCHLVSRILQPNVERLFRYLQHEVLFDVGQGTTRNLHMIAKHPNLPEYRASITRIHSAIPSASEIKDGYTFETGTAVHQACL